MILGDNVVQRLALGLANEVVEPRLVIDAKMLQSPALAQRGNCIRARITSRADQKAPLLLGFHHNLFGLLTGNISVKPSLLQQI